MGDLPGSEVGRAACPDGGRRFPVPDNIAIPRRLGNEGGVESAGLRTVGELVCKMPSQRTENRAQPVEILKLADI